MPVASGCGGSGVIGGKLYVYSMCLADGSFQPGLYVYSPGTNSWGSRISAPFHRFPAVAVVNGKLYLAGGLNSGGSASSYDPATGKWTSLSPMSFERQSATAVGLNGLLYVIGGFAAFGGQVGTVEVYDPGTRQWRALSEMPTERWSLGAGAINGRVYAVGGHGGTTLPTTEVYLP